MAVTIKDIAKILNVNPSTVSRALNDNSQIPEKTRERIKKVASELNFEFNYNARSLIKKQTNTVGIILHQDQDSFSYFLGLLLYHVRLSLEKAELDSIITTPINPLTNKSNIEKLITQKKVDGLLIIDYEIEKKSLEKLEKTKFPSVILHFKPQNYYKPKLNYVISDSEKGGFIATNHLLSLGLKKILTLTFDKGQKEFNERTNGYIKALTAHGFNKKDQYIFFCDCKYHSGYDFIIKNANMMKDFDAIFAQADIVAFGVINALTDLGIKVPDEISVIGYSDLELSIYSRPTMTTIQQSIDQLVSIGCNKLIDILNGKNVEEKLKAMLEPTLIIRDSCIKEKR